MRIVLPHAARRPWSWLIFDVGKNRMLLSGIENFWGSWISASGQRMTVVKRSRRTANVSLFGRDGHPIIRPYMHHAPTVDLLARYDENEGFLEIELWHRKSGFALSLLHESEHRRDGTWHHFVAPALVRLESDAHLDAYYGIFGKLDHYTREPNQAPEPTTMAVTSRAPSSTSRASHGRGSS